MTLRTRTFVGIFVATALALSVSTWLGERAMRDYLKGKYADLIARMDEKKDLSAEDEKLLQDAIKDWKQSGMV